MISCMKTPDNFINAYSSWMLISGFGRKTNIYLNIYIYMSTQICLYQVQIDSPMISDTSAVAWSPEGLCLGQWCQRPTWHWTLGHAVRTAQGRCLSSRRWVRPGLRILGLLGLLGVLGCGMKLKNNIIIYKQFKAPIWRLKKSSI